MPTPAQHNNADVALQSRITIYTGLLLTKTSAIHVQIERAEATTATTGELS